MAHAYQQATDWHRRRAPIAPGPGGPEAMPPVAVRARAAHIDGDWVAVYARAAGATFLGPDDFEPVARLLAPIKERLAEARERIGPGDEPHVRPV
jgi:hypothetical protein